MAQLMALDYGKKRSGLAATDDLQLIASGLTTVETPKLMDFFSRYFSSNSVEALVVGLPIDLRGNLSEVEKDILVFIEGFQKAFPDIEVHRLDERFTSKLASMYISQSGKSKKERQKKELIDQVSATIILQNFLDKKK